MRLTGFAGSRVLPAVVLLAVAASACVPVQEGLNQVPEANVSYNEIRDGSVHGMPAQVDDMMSDFLAGTGSFAGNRPIPGCSVGIMEADEIEHVKGYGIADLDTNRPFTYATPSVVASISKTVTALAALRLVELGLLDLEDSVQEHLPFVAATTTWGSLTVRQLLSHTSGLARDPAFNAGLNDELELANYWDDSTWPDDTPGIGIFPLLVWVSYAATQVEGFEPGYSARYSNTGYMLLGAIIELIAAQEPEEIASTYNNFERFAWRYAGGSTLNHGKFSLALNEYWRQDDIKDLAKGYRYDPETDSFTQMTSPVPGGPAGWEGPAGGWTMTIGDLVRLMVDIQNNRIISGELKDDEMMVVHGSDSNGNWGLGVNKITKLGRPVYMHDGAYPGYRARYTVWPDERFGVAITCNADDADVRRLTDLIGAFFLDGSGPEIGPGTESLQAAQLQEVDDDDPGFATGRSEGPAPTLAVRQREEIDEAVGRIQASQQQLIGDRERFAAGCPGCEDELLMLARQHGFEVFEPLLGCQEGAQGRGQVSSCVREATDALLEQSIIDQRQQSDFLRWSAQWEPACPLSEVPTAEFTDRDAIPEVHRDNIDCASFHDIVRGFADGSFGPTLPVRRDQMAAFIARTLDAAGITLPAATGDRFTDVAVGSTHDEAIHRLAAAGIVQGGAGGLPASSYGPDLGVRRDQMASFLLRAAAHATDQELASDTQRFPDVDANNAHFQNVNGAFEAELAAGFPDGNYGPGAGVRRDQMGTFVMRLFHYVDANAT